MWAPCGFRHIPCCSLLSQDLGNTIHGPQIRTQSVMQALIIDTRLSFSIGQRCLALDHALGEPASHTGCATGGICNAPALSHDGEGKNCDGEG